jgi:signal transduction histidine kinase
VTVKGSLTGNVPGSVETTVYRIAQEALTNAAKHAKATRAEVDVEQTVQGLICSVRDDGIGLEASASKRVDKSGIGLREMKERVTALGGVMRMGTNKDDRGTDLTFEIPLES